MRGCGETLGWELRELGVEEFGYAVEVGAADGLMLSQTVDLEDRGWQVLCIEPNPLTWGDLCRNRKLCMPYACSSENRELVEFHSFKSETEAGIEHYTAGSGLTYDYEVLDRVGGKHVRKAEHQVFRIPVRTLDYCLNAAGFLNLDVVIIDTEGHDMEVLKGFSIDHWKPTVVCIENWAEDESFRDWFRQHGYQRSTIQGYNEFYVRMT